MVSRVRPETGRRNAAAFAVSGVVAALLFLYPTSLNRPTGPTIEAKPALGSTAVGGSALSSTSGSTTVSPSASPSAGSGATSTTYTGALVHTRWGPVQVRITVAGARIVAAQAVAYPNDNARDEQINGYAVPMLNGAAVAAQSAGIDTVSGATYTSDGYIRSLQSALDMAHLG
jgi:uncharacterized protein with FMN-binding domain